MALELYIHPCIHTPSQHSPPLQKPLRIQIQGPLESIEKLLPSIEWHPVQSFPQPGGLELAKLTHQKLYGQSKETADISVRDEYLAWVREGGVTSLDTIDYYGVTFDHRVPANNPDPEVMVISIIEVDNDGGQYAHDVLQFHIDPSEYTGKRVLAVPRCCQVKKGRQDRKRVNDLVAERTYTS